MILVQGFPVQTIAAEYFYLGEFIIRSLLKALGEMGGKRESTAILKFDDYAF